MNIWGNVMIDEKELDSIELTEDVKIGLTNNDDEEDLDELNSNK